MRNAGLDVHRGHRPPPRRIVRQPQAMLEHPRACRLARQVRIVSPPARPAAAPRSDPACARGAAMTRVITAASNATPARAIDATTSGTGRRTVTTRTPAGSNRHQGAAAVSTVPVQGCASHEVTSSSERQWRNSSWPHGPLSVLQEDAQPLGATARQAEDDKRLCHKSADAVNVPVP